MDYESPTQITTVVMWTCRKVWSRKKPLGECQWHETVNLHTFQSHVSVILHSKNCSWLQLVHSENTWHTCKTFALKTSLRYVPISWEKHQNKIARYPVLIHKCNSSDALGHFNFQGGEFLLQKQSWPAVQTTAG